MLSLFTSSASRLASSTASAVKSALPSLVEQTQQVRTSLSLVLSLVLPRADPLRPPRPQSVVPSVPSPSTARAASAAKKISRYSALSLAPGQWHPSTRRVAASYPKPARAPFPASLAVKRCAALGPVVSSASVQVAHFKPHLTVLETLAVADITTLFAPSTRSTPSTRLTTAAPAPVPPIAVTPAPVAPTPVYEVPTAPRIPFAERPSKIPRRPITKTRRHPLSAAGKLKVDVLRTYMEKLPIKVFDPELYNAAKAHALRCIAREEPYERAREAAKKRCRATRVESLEDLCSRLMKRIHSIVFGFVDNLIGLNLPEPRRVAHRPLSPLAPRSHTRFGFSSKIDVRSVPVGPRRQRRGDKARGKTTRREGELRRVAIRNSFSMQRWA